VGGGPEISGTLAVGGDGAFQFRRLVAEVGQGGGGGSQFGQEVFVSAGALQFAFGAFGFEHGIADFVAAAEEWVRGFLVPLLGCGEFGVGLLDLLVDLFAFLLKLGLLVNGAAEFAAFGGCSNP
jgi:hypothetical protein